MQGVKYNHSSDEVVKLLQSANEVQENLGFKILYQRCYGLIENLVLKNNGQLEDVKVVFHDGLIALHQQVNKEGFELSSKIETFLYSICRNKWLMELRKRKHSKEVSLVDKHQWIPIEDNASIQIELNEGQKVLVSVLKKMGEDCYKLIQLYYYLKIKMKKIAKKLGIPNEAAAKNRKARCMKKLRSLVLNNPQYQQYLKEYLNQISK